ncbi:hypothetical protein PIB30_043676 [Stylosanthes scabra]|uniref:PB1-like domain-containing protein n=1 Tax=Stylosanthes scabra TaxID=79078 RepID=A0ABU6QFS2_9FABA|nr:hypothetical protein [Stylosanthes scabra]
MDGFVVTVFHHAGRFERYANGDRHYVDGKVTRFAPMDVDFVNKQDLLEMAKEIGYMKLKNMFWHEHTSIIFEAGLHRLISDREINEMCDFALYNNLKEFHIYLDHPVDVPIMPGPDHEPEPIVVESSSSDSYESAEDEAYKPPLPGRPGFEISNGPGSVGDENANANPNEDNGHGSQNENHAQGNPNADEVNVPEDDSHMNMLLRDLRPMLVLMMKEG